MGRGAGTRFGVTVAIGALALAAGAAPASAAKQIRVTTKTTVKVEPTSTPSQARYSGKLTCKPPKGDDEAERKRARKAADECEGDRTVSVFHVQPGEDFLIGIAKTSDRGGWQVIGNKPPAGDRVRVEVASETRDNFDVRCGARTKFATVPF